MAGDIERIEASISDLADKIGEFQAVTGERLARLETKMDRHGDLCPFRESISKAANNSDRLKTVEGKIQNLELAMARAGFGGGLAGGGIVTVLGAVAYAVGKAAGLW